MIDAGWLNIGSLILGLVAWIIPAINLVEKNKRIINGLLLPLSVSALALSQYVFKSFITFTW
ncbi:hypothetical protein JNUCC1_01978 [Lentibacillus sp. JNUCC-1]|uniref:hypothetical protein n=1 Tax=Lentibacillus sp. JNUCC-1 TaxID=2654513 RepID=UPI00132795F5|nr:hypothetical protein [Lentibacillus sp. JNUCC-1]